MDDELVVQVDQQSEVSLVPLGWQRVIQNNRVIYISPSRHQLRSTAEITAYLQSDKGCKCGLKCPIFVDQLFNFDVQVPSLHMDFDTADNSFCCHSSNHSAKPTLAYEPLHLSPAIQRI